MAVARYRDRHSVAGRKPESGDARLLANILRTDLHAHRPLPADSELAQAIAVLARAQQDAVWDRTAYAGAAPITRASGKSRSVTYRRVKNNRLAAVGCTWAFCAPTASPGARPNRIGCLRPTTLRAVHFSLDAERAGRLLHDHTADRMARVVSRIPGAAATIIPFDVRHRVMTAGRRGRPGSGGEARPSR